MRKINSIVIHVTDSPDTLDIGAKEIKEWHLAQGWTDIGYHYVIRRNGKVEKGRPIEKAGAHVKGYNKNSIGIAWVGKKELSEKQTAALVNLVFNLMCDYNVPVNRVFGHTELDISKTCPNIDMGDLRLILGRMVSL